MFKLYKKYLTPFASLVIGACLFTFLQVFAELQLPALMSSIVDVGITNKDMNYVLVQGAIMLAWAFGSLGCVVVAALCAARASMGMGRDLRLALFSEVQAYSLFEFNFFGTSTLITRNTNDVQQIERFTQMLMTMAVMTPVMFIGAIVMAFSTNTEMALLIFVSVPIIVLLVALFLRKGMPLLRSLQSRIDNLNRITREELQGVRVIRAYNKQDYETERFGLANKDLSETYVKVGRLIGALIPLLMLVLNLTIIALYYFGAVPVDQGRLSAGEIMALVQYVTLILMSLMMVSMVFAILPRTLAACERVAAVLDTNPTIVDVVDAQEDSHEASEHFKQALQRDFDPLLEMKHVSFCYPGAKRATVRDLSFSLKRGTTTILMGPTGSGKSLILNLMTRMYDATEGEILYYGRDVRMFPLEALRSSFSVAPQKATLFTGSIADNLRFAKHDATDDEMWEVLRCAQAAEFIEKYPEGLAYQITQGGENLSGGQRQRMAIARTLLHDADLYLFDDSFSALDFKTDTLVRQSIAEYLADKTVLIASQRVSVALDADQVILLNSRGEIEQTGTHEKLLETNEDYRILVESQMGDHLEEPVELADSQVGEHPEWPGTLTESQLKDRSVECIGSAELPTLSEASSLRGGACDE